MDSKSNIRYWCILDGILGAQKQKIAEVHSVLLGFVQTFSFITMGLFSKKKKKERNYRSEEAKDDPDPDFSKKKDPYLIIGDAPPKPFFAGAGLSSNTVYQVQRDRPEEEVQKSKGMISNDIESIYVATRSR